MAKVFCLNLSQNLYKIKNNTLKDDKDYNFDCIFNCVEDLKKNINEIKPPICFIFFGESTDNILYKQDGIIDSILNKNLSNSIHTIEGIEFKYDGIYDLFNSIPLLKHFENNQKILLNSKTVIDETLNKISINRLLNNKIYKLTKSHILIKITNGTKIMYFLDLCVSKCQTYSTFTFNDLHNTFINKTITNLKVFFENRELSDTNFNLIKVLNELKVRFDLIGIIENNKEVNKNVLKLCDIQIKPQPFSNLQSPKLKPITNDSLKQLNKTRFDLINKVPPKTPNTTPILKPSAIVPKSSSDINYIKLNDKLETISTNINKESSNLLDSSQNLLQQNTVLKEYIYENIFIDTYKLLLPNYPLDPTTLAIVPNKQFISDEDLKSKIRK